MGRGSSLRSAGVAVLARNAPQASGEPEKGPAERERKARLREKDNGWRHLVNQACGPNTLRVRAVGAFDLSLQTAEVCTTTTVMSSNWEPASW
jgi:hypothetical protein